ncbi:hypothetical protein SDC9_130523 [bioreactor metagenome]|uniref:Uncharacterized protein n=1 Tax=bioreactor metagenome TaxID=1076179 RepID=A0A645D2M6_9ZZZZ
MNLDDNKKSHFNIEMTFFLPKFQPKKSKSAIF